MMLKPWSHRIKSRRGQTLIEALLASSITVLAMTGLAGVLSLSSRMERKARLTSEVNQEGAFAVQRIVRDVREASVVQMPASYRLRIYFPSTDANGRYVMTQTNYNSWVEYYRSNAAGAADASGACLWRLTSAGASDEVAEDVSLFSISTFQTKTARVSLTLTKSEGCDSVSVPFTQQVTYLRDGK
jgi:Tfp pilus assembly protein PilV